MRPLSPVVFTDLCGMNTADPPTRLPDGIGTSAANVLLEPASLGRRRPSLETFELTSGPSYRIYGLYRFQPKTAGSQPALFALSQQVPLGGGPVEIDRYDASGWTSITTSDTMAQVSGSVTGDGPRAVQHNGKLFFAYDSNVNRLHVYDPTVSTTALRRVGIEASAAATVANGGGAGAYAAVTRYYKIQFKLKSGSDTIATSELSPSVTFTPGGANANATVTMPTAPDSATHWVVFGSADNVTYYNLSGDVATSSTTYADTAAPSSYSSGTVAPTVGINIPPPSAKFLLSDGNRLLMAGCWETSATSTQTATRTSRVWFTDVLGARDNTGEDESIPQSADARYWVDCGEHDGDVIVGLAGPLDGSVYVFKRKSIWRLSPTGIPTQPYRAERLTGGSGAFGEATSAAAGTYGVSSFAIGEDGAGNPALYFRSASGPKRIVSGYGVEDLGADLRQNTVDAGTAVTNGPILWDENRGVVWFIAWSSNTAYAFQPKFEQRTAMGVRGGWTKHTFGMTLVYAAELHDNYLTSGANSAKNQRHLVLGGASGSDDASLAILCGESRRDLGSTAIAASVTSAIYQPGGLLNRVGFGHAVLEWDYPGAATAIGVSVASVIGGPLAVTGTVTDTTTSSTYTTAVVQEKLESIQLSDVFGLQATVTLDTAVDGSERPRIHALTIPVTAQEGA